MATKIKQEFEINEDNGEFTLYTKPRIELNSDEFGIIVSTISERLQWKHLGIALAGMDGAGVEFEKKIDGITLVIEDTIWFGLNIQSNSKEVLEKIKIILQDIFSKMT